MEGPPEKADKYDHARRLDVSKNAEQYAAIKENMAMKYPFELDPFQQQAVICMEKDESVFVAAHTSAGKTVVAEYAVALSRKNGTRVIYTSPIKALSNQKFRDFKLVFDDVGLITGDIQLNPEAYCLIMTTEILRSMLYNGSEVIRELEWVIFDEVHYINDIEVRIFPNKIYFQRGHVWEEVLIMLPPYVKIVMLSATVPNSMEFADWVGRIKHRTINVIQTTKRPVPLKHFLYTGQDGKTRDDIFCIFSDGNFLRSGYDKASEAKNKKAQALANKMGGPKPRPGQSGTNHPWQLNKNNKNVYINLIYHLNSKELLPMIVFIFSRQRCDEIAQLLKSEDLTTKEEKAKIYQFFARSISRLTGSDKELPQILLMREHCMRGYAVHHSGILPIIKEVIELLFQQGLVKILFATETFAMGVNMPARTVVFDSIEKHDGKKQRLLNPTEYIQMAGRAGRRGLDSTGTVIILAKGPTVPDINDLTKVLKGEAVNLESRFRMTYSMMLNLLRVEHMRIEDMLKRSYVEKNALRMVLDREERLKQVDKEMAALPEVECAFCFPQPSGKAGDEDLPSLMGYFHALLNYNKELNTTWKMLVSRSKEGRYFVPGRVIVFHYDELGIVGRLAVILKTSINERKEIRMTLFVPVPDKLLQNDETKEMVYKKGLTEKEQKRKKEELLLEHALINGIEGIQHSQHDRSFKVLEDVDLDSLLMVCKRTIPKIDADAIIREYTRLKSRPQSPDRQVQRIFNELNQLAEKFAIRKEDGNQASTDLFYILGEDTDRKEMDIVNQLRRIKPLREQLESPNAFPCRQCPQIQEHMKIALKRRWLNEDKESLATSMASFSFSGEYAGRLKVLRTLNYIDREDMVLLKGKIACEISNQELLITELILDNKFNDRSPSEIAAMLSALTCQFDGKGNRKAYYNGNGQQGVQNGNGNGNTNTGADDAEQQQNASADEVERVPKELLKELRDELLDAAKRIDAVQNACEVNNSVVEELKFGLMEVCYLWASGIEFQQITKISDAQEGIIVRCIQRLDEVLKDIRKAANIVGNPDLVESIDLVRQNIHRNIVFAASLYITETD